MKAFYDDLFFVRSDFHSPIHVAVMREGKLITMCNLTLSNYPVGGIGRVMRQVKGRFEVCDMCKNSVTKLNRTLLGEIRADI